MTRPKITESAIRKMTPKEAAEAGRALGFEEGRAVAEAVLAQLKQPAPEVK